MIAIMATLGHQITGCLALGMNFENFQQFCEYFNQWRTGVGSCLHKEGR